MPAAPARASHRLGPRGPLRIVARRGKSLVFLDSNEVWAFEAADRLTSVHTPHGTFDLDLSLASIEASFGRALTRVHRNWLVNAAYIKELERDGAETTIFVGAGIGQISQASGCRWPASARSGCARRCWRPRRASAAPDPKARTGALAA